MSRFWAPSFGVSTHFISDGSSKSVSFVVRAGVALLVLIRHLNRNSCLWYYCSWNVGQYGGRCVAVQNMLLHCRYTRCVIPYVQAKQPFQNSCDTFQPVALRWWLINSCPRLFCVSGFRRITSKIYIHYTFEITRPHYSWLGKISLTIATGRTVQANGPGVIFSSLESRDLGMSCLRLSSSLVGTTQTFIFLKQVKLKGQ